MVWIHLLNYSRLLIPQTPEAYLSRQMTNFTGMRWVFHSLQIYANHSTGWSAAGTEDITMAQSGWLTENCITGFSLMEAWQLYQPITIFHCPLPIKALNLYWSGQDLILLLRISFSWPLLSNIIIRLTISTWTWGSSGGLHRYRIFLLFIQRIHRQSIPE